MGSYLPRTTRRRVVALHLALLLTLLAGALASAASPAAAATTPPAGELPPRLSGRTLSRPGGYLTAPAQGDPEDIALAFIRQERRRLGLTEDDLAEVVLKDRYTSASNGLTHLYYRQRLGGVEVFNGDININVARDGRILNLGNGFVADLRGAVGQLAAPRLSAVEAVGQAAGQLQLTLTEAVTPLAAAASADGTQLLSDGGISHDPIPARLIYMPMAPGDVRLAWDLTLRLKNNEDWLSLRLDAASGQILSSVNYFAHSDAAIDPADHGAAEHDDHAAAVAAAPLAGVSDGSSYNVYAFPKESPNDGPRTLVTNPADSVASPFGWHDTNGVAGAEHTITRGNNVHAYQDQGITNQSSGDEPDGGPALQFNYPLDLSQQPGSYVAASTAHLFYASNYIHDVLSRLGFDEAAGNFQQTNYSGAGLGNDYVRAEAQDGNGVVNANFATPPDGALPRMQMYLGNTRASFTLNAPAAVAGSYANGTASFGPQSFDITADMVLVNDGIVGAGAGASANDGCESFVTNVAGKIALVDRGFCTFITKATNAMNAGAVGLIIANNTPRDPAPGMSGAGAAVPTLSVTYEMGVAIKQATQNETVNATMVRSDLRSDGSLDNGVIAHEYGHGLSNRLTGGPSNTSCLASAEQAGEGWSDFLALVLTAKPGDTAQDARSMGAWMMHQPADGFGIRRQLYSTDPAINTFTYDSLKAIALVNGTVPPHQVGEVWASMLWDMYWRLVERHGFDADLVAGNGGNRLALQLVIDGMKLQPCDPTFVEARDGILAADVANSGGANQCLLWEAFAGRGLGYSADAGSVSSHTDGTEAFDLPPQCTLIAAQETLDVCIPSAGSVAVSVGESFAGPVTLSASGLPAGASASFGPNPAATATTSTLTIDTAGADPGSATVTITGAGPSATYTYDVELSLADAQPAAPGLTAPADGATGQPDTPTLTWGAPAQAASYRVELASEPTFSAPLYDLTVRAASFTPDTPLAADTTYFWRVTPANGCGAGSRSATGSFTVRDSARILLVDDTVESTASRARYTAALDALGKTYDVWYGETIDDEPSLAKLKNYNTVIWFGGYDFYGVPSPASEARLSDWLPSGRCLVVSVEELYARRGMSVTPFMRDYLGVGSMADDSMHTAVTGVAGTLFDGVGPLAMSYAGNNYSDHMAPNAGGTLVLTGNGAGGSGAAIAREGSGYRTLYMGFPAEALAPANLITVLSRTLGWCEQAAASVSDLSLSPDLDPVAPSLLPGQPVTYTLSFRNGGAGTATNVRLSLSLPAQLVDVSTTSSGPALTPVSGVSNSWDVADMASGASGTLTLSAKVSPDLALATSLRIEASITGAGLDLDSADQAAAVGLAVRVPSLSFAQGSLSVAEGSGAQQLPVRLSEANPYAATRVDYAVSGGTATPGGDFALAAGTLSIPAGAAEAPITLTAHGDRLAEGAETALIGLTSPRGAALGAPGALSVTITDTPPGSVLASSQSLSVAEGGEAASYTLTLDRAPASDVTVTLSAGSQVSLAATTLTFTPDNWSVPQQVAVSAVDDGAEEGAHSATISHSVASADWRFAGAPLDGVTVSIGDNDGGQQTQRYSLFLPVIR